MLADDSSNFIIKDRQELMILMKVVLVILEKNKQLKLVVIYIKNK